MSEQQMMSMLEILVDASSKLQHMRYTNSLGVWPGVKIYQKVIKNLSQQLGLSEQYIKNIIKLEINS
jgi:hypothetical protein